MAAMTFKEIASNWSDAPSESYRREIWSSLRTGDWLAACRSAVEGTDTAVLEDWFDGHPILDWWRKGDDASAQVATAYLGCSLAICRAKRLMAAAPEDCLGASQRLVHAVEQTIGRKANGLNPRELLNLEWLSGEMLQIVEREEINRGIGEEPGWRNWQTQRT